MSPFCFVNWTLLLLRSKETMVSEEQDTMDRVGTLTVAVNSLDLEQVKAVRRVARLRGRHLFEALSAACTHNDVPIVLFLLEEWPQRSAQLARRGLGAYTEAIAELSRGFGVEVPVSTPTAFLVPGKPERMDDACEHVLLGSPRLRDLLIICARGGFVALFIVLGDLLDEEESLNWVYKQRELIFEECLGVAAGFGNEDIVAYLLHSKLSWRHSGPARNALNCAETKDHERCATLIRAAIEKHFPSPPQ